MNKFSAINREIFDKLQVDFMRPMSKFTEKLLNAGLRVMYYRYLYMYFLHVFLCTRNENLIFSGNLDLIVPYPTSENMFRHLQWNGTVRYLNATRKPLMIDKIVKGFVQI